MDAKLFESGIAELIRVLELDAHMPKREFKVKQFSHQMVGLELDVTIVGGPDVGTIRAKGFITFTQYD